MASVDPLHAERASGPRLHWTLPVLALAALVWWRIRAIGLVGLDTLPILYTAELPELLSGRLMPNHNMYRPVLSLSVWTEKQLFGLWAPGYQATNALCLAFAALALGHLARRVVGTELAALVAALALLLHPSLIDVAPFVERRSELLMVGFAALSAASATRPGRGAALRAALFGLLAMGSKDNGLVALPLAAGAAWIAAQGTPRARVARAGAACWPLALATVAFAGWRARVVGGLGGRGDREPLALVAEHPGQVLELVDRALRPEPFASERPLTAVLLAAVAAALLAVLWLGHGARRPRSTRPGSTRPGTARPWRGVLLGALWTEAFLLTYAARGVWRLWYVLPLAAGLSLCLGGVTERLAEAWRARGERPLAARAAGLGLVALALSLGWQARFGVVLGDLRPLRERTRRIEAFYGELERRIETFGPGIAIAVPELPSRIETPPGPGYYDNVRDVTKTTVRAWAAVRLPGERVRMKPSAERAGPAERYPDDYLLVHPDF